MSIGRLIRWDVETIPFEAEQRRALSMNYDLLRRPSGLGQGGSSCAESNPPRANGSPARSTISVTFTRQRDPRDSAPRFYETFF